MTSYRAMRVYFKDERNGFFIMMEKSNVSGDLIRIITLNGSNQLSIEFGVKLKEIDPGFYMGPIGNIKETNVTAVAEVARKNPPTSKQTFREWADAFIEMLINEGLLEKPAAGADLPPSWGRS